MIKDDSVFKIRPAGRHLLTIGRDLIQDQYAAIVELVKNAYDADSPDVSIKFKANTEATKLSIIVEDHGHGMDRNTVVNKWLVPSTDDKLNRKFSPKGRVMQGRKGIGRYAASILGNDLLLETVTEVGETTSVYVEWKSFESAEFLDDVEVLVETNKTSHQPGTKLTINGDQNNLAEWTRSQIDKLDFELKKLISPVKQQLSKDLDAFNIKIEFENFWENQDDNIARDIAPYPIFELFDYRISGLVHADGTGSLTFSNRNVDALKVESIEFTLQSSTNCGEVQFDIRAYDRDRDAIEQLIKRGLKDEEGNYLSKLQAKQLLDSYNGIGVYRNGFRIRPLGDPNYDWLQLAEQRVQNPGLRISSSQVIGYVLIQPEELSGLEEKSARDGLRDNYAFQGLIKTTQKVINLLESRRFMYRKEKGIDRSSMKVDPLLNSLYILDDLKSAIKSTLVRQNVPEKVTNEVISAIDKRQKESETIAEDLKQTVATYQGQATLGKIINVILHEGRRPLNYFKNQIPNLKYYFEKLKITKDLQYLEKIIPISEGLGDNAQAFVTLFGRLDPLAAGKRGGKKLFRLKSTIENSFRVFEIELNQHGITPNLNCDNDFQLFGWAQDINVVMTNLIDNSIYWILENKSEIKKIDINVQIKDKTLQFIDYRDSGPGIEETLIDSGIIFEPGYTQKPHGQGLGLAIAGEAATRNDLELKVLKTDRGSYFRIQPIVSEGEELNENSNS